MYAGRTLDSKWPDLSEAICNALLSKERKGHRSLTWLQSLPVDDKPRLLECCTNPLSDAKEALHQLGVGEKEQSHVLMLRGLLAFKLLLHCLQKRHNVDYGITDRWTLVPFALLMQLPRQCSMLVHIKRHLCRQGKHRTHMAVPYRACGTPAPRSEFKHPDMSLCLTQLAYMQTGLSPGQVRESLVALFRMPLRRRRAIYQCGLPQNLLSWRHDVQQQLKVTVACGTVRKLEGLSCGLCVASAA